MKNTKIVSKTLSMIAAVAVICCLNAAPAFADTEGNGSIDLDGKALTITNEKIQHGDKTEPAKSTIKLTGKGGKVILKEFKGTLILDNVTLSEQLILTEKSDVTLKLKGDNKINADGKGIETKSAGIQVNKGETLTIDGQGSLKVKGGNQSAGIGGSFDPQAGGTQSSSGNIQILGGTIDAEGGDGESGGAGIGSGANFGGSTASYEHATTGDIVISGGTITAKGNGQKHAGAGIGGGNHVSGGIITIKGNAHIVKAEGGSGGGAGIGSGLGSHEAKNGEKGPGGFTGGTITIRDSVKIDEAIGGWLAAGIGGGGYCDSGKITIESGTIDLAKGGWGNKDAYHHGAAGIGAGYQGHCNITINGGTIKKALGGVSGAGIGSGTATETDKRSNPDVLKKSTIRINGGTIYAEGGADGGAGIGGGFAIGKADITISGGDVTAVGAASSRAEKAGGAGIGSAVNNNTGTEQLNGKQYKYAHKTELNIDITGGTVKATGGWGASGIGSGAHNVLAKTITIEDKADVAAFADGTKFAVDTFERDRHPATGKGSKFTERKAPGVLQGTFIDTAIDTAAGQEKSAGKYEGLKVTVYKDMTTAEDKDIVFGSKQREENLPQGYRSFAVSMAKSGRYVIQADNDWFAFDTLNKVEEKGWDKDEAKPTAHYKTGDSTMSDNSWLYPRKMTAYYVDGQIKVTKKVFLNDEAYNVTEDFYAGVFTDANFTAPLIDSENKPVIVKLSLNNQNEVSETISGIPLDENGKATYYVTEVDQSGTPVSADAGFGYDVKVEGSTVNLAEGETGEVTIINTATEGYYKEDGGSTATTDTVTTTESSSTTTAEAEDAVQTSDDFNMMPFVLAAIAAAAVCGVLIIRRKSTK